MKLYLSEADFDFIVSDLQRKLPNTREHQDRRSEISSKLLQIRINKGKAPIVGAVNITGEITQFTEISAVGPKDVLPIEPMLSKLTRFPVVQPDGALKIYIDRSAMLTMLRKTGAPYEVMEAAKNWKWMPAPNPKLEGERNALGQTEEEFWLACDMMVDQVAT